MNSALRSAFDRLSDHAFREEAVVLAEWLPPARLTPAQQSEADALARQLIGEARRRVSPFALESFLRRFGLDSMEGVALLRLAEALPRIPDDSTAERLVRETLGSGDWKSGEARWPVALSAKGMGIAARLLGKGEDASLLSRAGAPAVMRAARLGVRWMGGRFVLGDRIETAIARAGRDRSSLYSYDMLGESARSDVQAMHYTEQYLYAVQAVGENVNRELPLMQRDGISVKLSALDPRYEALQLPNLRGRLLPRLKRIVLAAMEAGVPITVDAEEAARLEVSLELFAELALDAEIRSFSGLGLAVQAYQTRAVEVIGFIKNLAEERNAQIPVRLVKGAYWDAEIKQAQVMGLPEFPVFTRKAYTDLSMLACARAMLETGEKIYPQFGTHNARTIADILAMAEGRALEFQRLYGMGEAVYAALRKMQGVSCRVYAPVGPHRELLAYLIRRLLENGANSSFLHALGNSDIPESSLARDPVAEAVSQALQPNASIHHPRDLFRPERGNAPGYDLSFRQSRQAWKITSFPDPPLPAVMPKDAVATAQAAFEGWSSLTVAARAEHLERAVDMLERHREEAVHLLITEAGKTWGDAIGEWREAQDFCRYYAAQARKLCGAPMALPGPTAERNRLSLHPRGVFLCISPWNFPLAIFIGQVVAALAAGNTVVAKPAEQTPRIAAVCVHWLREAGIPEGAVQLAVGLGETVGAALVSDPGIAGVAFTGSTETAWAINRALAAKRGPIVPFIAETGGQNAMIVDSTALLEQTVGHAVASAFGSAGQRCSALRVVYVQEEIADAFYALLEGAMQELHLGDPAEMATDIGPVIDAEAQEKLFSHIERFRIQAKRWAATPLPENLSGPFVAPHLFEIGSLSELPGEVFGPVLHLIRYRDLDSIIHEINATGFGLTLGIETRLGSRAEEIARRVRVGNIYINRVMTGAVVGAQPFGGEGLSGTGPKAGGPHYLLRFMTERVISENLAAVGGNIDLLMGKAGG